MKPRFILFRRSGVYYSEDTVTGLTEPQIGSIQRYLDAVRSNLLFAKSVILIEGDAEEILVPVMVKKVLGVSLDELGISLINIRSTGFLNVGILFHATRIKKKCAIVTDLDAAFIDTTPAAGDSDPVKKYKADCKASADAGASRKVILDQFQAGSPVRLCAPRRFQSGPNGSCN